MVLLTKITLFFTKLRLFFNLFLRIFPMKTANCINVNRLVFGLISKLTDDLQTELSKTSTVCDKISLIYANLPSDFVALLIKQNTDAISAFALFVELLDKDINPRSVDRYRRSEVAKTKKAKAFNPIAVA